MTETRLMEKITLAIESVQLFSRFNDWTSNCVPELPIEICRHGSDGDAEVVERFPAEVGEKNALDSCLQKARAASVLQAIESDIRAATIEECAQAAENCDTLGPSYQDDELTSEGMYARRKVRQIVEAIRSLKNTSSVDNRGG